MMGSNHFVLGAAATAAYLIKTGHPPANSGVDFLGAVLLGGVIALLPDIDSPNTKIRHLFGVGSRQARRNLSQWPKRTLITNLFNLFRWLLAVILDGVAFVLPHRGPTHWLVVFISLVYGVYWLSESFNWPSWVWPAFAIGYASHLLADACTKSGVKLFAPFYNRAVGLPIRFLRVRTGSWQENVTLMGLLLLIVGWMVL